MALLGAVEVPGGSGVTPPSTSAMKYTFPHAEKSGCPANRPLMFVVGREFDLAQVHGAEMSAKITSRLRRNSLVPSGSLSLDNGRRSLPHPVVVGSSGLVGSSLISSHRYPRRKRSGPCRPWECCRIDIEIVVTMAAGSIFFTFKEERELDIADPSRTIGEQGHGLGKVDPAAHGP